jgi:hypothetical protein
MVIELSEADIRILLPYAREEKKELQGYYDLGHSEIKSRIDSLSEIIDKVEKVLEKKIEKKLEEPNSLGGYTPLQRLLHYAWEEKKELQGYYDLSHSEIKSRIDSLSEIIDKVEKKLLELEE